MVELLRHHRLRGSVVDRPDVRRDHARVGRPVTVDERRVSAFSTPTVVHFAMVLLTAAIMAAPWGSVFHAGAIVALAGAGGIVYMVRVFDRSRGKTEYRADAEDWTWYAILPLLAYATIAAAAIRPIAGHPEAMFGIAGAALLLIFIGIHNSWDVVTDLALHHRPEQPDSSPSEER